MLIKKPRRQVYSEAFKRQMVSEYEAGGISYQELGDKYNFSSNNLQRWRSELSFAKVSKKRDIVKESPKIVEEVEDQERLAMRRRIRELERIISDKEIDLYLYGLLEETYKEACDDKVVAEVERQIGRAHV